MNDEMVAHDLGQAKQYILLKSNTCRPTIGREVHEITENWITIYNKERSRRSLGKVSPRDHQVQAEINALGMSA